jgi:hypothetical protein
MSISEIWTKLFLPLQVVGVIIVNTNVGQDFLLSLYLSPYYHQILAGMMLAVFASGIPAIISIIRSRGLPIVYTQLLGGFGLWLAGILIGGMLPLVESAPSHGPLVTVIATGSYSGMIFFYVLAWLSVRSLPSSVARKATVSAPFL